ncbi:MAG: hypothetical protein LKI27_08005 [Actinomyces sp.]|jgi:hypothetical protein|nr:hypothetical protein [Actinomyces sp.]MCI1662822.1 hypothetical protein [Actinomyces sp.]
MTATRRRTANLWPRRILTGLALVAAVALLVLGAVRLVGALGNAVSGGGGDDATSESGQSGDDAQSGPGLADRMSGGTSGLQSVVIDPCSAQDLTVQIGVSGPVAVGAGATVQVTLTGASAADCSMTTGQLALRVLSGDQVIADGSACQATDGQSGEGADAATGSGTPLLFATGDSWSGTLTWDGGVHDGCGALDADGDGAGDIADAGTYRAQVLLDGQRIGDEAVFEVR